MEKQLYAFHFKNRLCSTLLRLEWLMAVATALPFLLKLFTGIAVLGLVLFWLLLTAVLILSLFSLLLFEDFRKLYSADKFAQISAASERVTASYDRILPVLVTIAVVFFAVTIWMVVTNKSMPHRSGKIASALLALVFALLSAAIFYAFLR